MTTGIQAVAMASFSTVADTDEYQAQLAPPRNVHLNVQLSGTTPLLRDYFPKGTELGKHTPEHLAAVENEINRRPRITLNDSTPIDLFASLLASLNHQVLRR